MEESIIWNKALEISKKAAKEMRNESDGDYVGAEREDTFTIENKTYLVNTCAFWEKVSHFDCTVTSSDGYYRHKNCITF